MKIQVTEEAAEILNRSLDLSHVDKGAGGIRLRGSRGLSGGFDVQIELAENALEGDAVITEAGIRFFVDPEVATTIPDAILEAELQHDIVKVLPAT
jgi:Fe-S cluster assembly iron-binding protein IscA